MGHRHSLAFCNIVPKHPSTMYLVAGSFVFLEIIASLITAWPTANVRSSLSTNFERPSVYFPSDLGFLLGPSSPLRPSSHVDDSSSDCKCGRIHSNRIVGGSRAESGEWCWQAKVMVWSQEEQGSFFLCGGSIINDKYILSAAHCFYGMEYYAVDVYLGSYRLFRDYQGKKYPVASVTVHPDYNSLTKANDIALIKLARRIRYTNRICSVCLPSKDNDYTGEMATITGWGALKSGGDSPQALMEAEVKILPDEKCRKEYGYLYPSQMCAAAPGTDACQGDSGGPLVHKDSNGIWDLIGIVSAGKGCADPNFAGLYTNVYKFLPWIYNITKKDGYCSRN